MMNITQWTFWICAGAVAYAYALFPMALWAVCRLARFRHRRKDDLASTVPEGVSVPSHWPRVSLLVAAYNEEIRLPAKLRNLDEINYPRNLIECIVVSDGSTDDTDRILAAAERPGLRSFRLPARLGKPTALNLAAAKASGDIFVFSDASTALAPDAVSRLVRHFSDERIGVVCGSVDFQRTEESAATEGVYWRYETALRRMEAQIGATLTASGALYAVRRSCFRPLAPGAILDDFLIPMAARRLGYRVEYDPEARSQEVAAASVNGEFARRVRLAAGGFQSLGTLTRGALSSPAVFWTFLSHKLLRWLAPVFLIGLFAASVALRERPAYGLALALQLVFFLWALLGWACCERLKGVRFALVGYFLLAMNVALLVGLARSLAGRQAVTWTRATG
jgi:cellulose synthase/poly-beta-1,6-N-acetylglucosamine synthase-like glycosyltransferase